MNQRTILPIVVVDDEPIILRILSLALDPLAYPVVSLPDAEEALSLMASERPALVISDVRLPGMTGVEFASQVKHDPRFADVPVLLMSAYGEPARHAADGFLAKPFDVENLTAEVQRLLCA